MPVYSVIVSQLVQHTETTQIFVYAANPDEIIEAISRREPHLNDMNLIWKGSNYGDKLGCGCCKDDICLDNTIRDINLAVAKSAGGSPQLAQIIPPISSVRIAEIEAYVERSHKE